MNRQVFKANFFSINKLASVIIFRANILCSLILNWIFSERYSTLIIRPNQRGCTFRVPNFFQ